MADQVLEAPPEEREQAKPTPAPDKKGWPLWGWAVFVVLGIVAAVITVKILQDAAAGSYSGGLPGGGVVLLPGANRGPALSKGSPAPDFTLQTLDGKPASLAEYRGQAVMVNFWATWCPPCRAEMPDMQQVYEARKGEGFTVLAVNIQEAPQPIGSFVNKYGLTFPILMDVSGEVTQLYGVYGLPSSYFIDREGRVGEVYVGPLAKAAIMAKVEGILK